MSLADYLAKNYLTADKKPEKKSKKRKRGNGETNGLVIEDDETGWNEGVETRERELAPTAVDTRSAEFRRAKTSNWTTLSGEKTSISNDDADADAIIAKTAAENAARNLAEDEDALVVDSENNAVMMDSGAHAGLQTAAQLASQIKKAEDAERSRLGAEGEIAMGKGAETIYRDATGRIVNVAMKRAEARRKAEDEAAKKAREEEDARGDVQRVEKAKAAEMLEKAKDMKLARYADDVEMNDELKATARWNDPAAGFLTKKVKEKKSVSGRPVYTGSADPNRYKIRPGYRWDGVDRGNGFEKKWFAARSKSKGMRELGDAWHGLDDDDDD